MRQPHVAPNRHVSKISYFQEHPRTCPWINFGDPRSTMMSTQSSPDARECSSVVLACPRLPWNAESDCLGQAVPTPEPPSASREQWQNHGRHCARDSLRERSVGWRPEEVRILWNRAAHSIVWPARSDISWGNPVLQNWHNWLSWNNPESSNTVS